MLVNHAAVSSFSPRSPRNHLPSSSLSCICSKPNPSCPVSFSPEVIRDDPACVHNNKALAALREVGGGVQAGETPASAVPDRSAPAKRKGGMTPAGKKRLVCSTEGTMGCEKSCGRNTGRERTGHSRSDTRRTQNELHTRRPQTACRGDEKTLGC
jgi:hypothetical protein